MVRGAAHPQLFWGKHASSPIFDAIKLLGAVPVTAKNLFKLFAAKSHVLLYPGSEREAVHNKGEEYKLFWLTDRNSREWLQVLGPQLYHLRPWEMMIYFKNDLMKIPMLSHHLKDSSRGTVRTRHPPKLAEKALVSLVLVGQVPFCLYGSFAGRCRFVNWSSAWR